MASYVQNQEVGAVGDRLADHFPHPGARGLFARHADDLQAAASQLIREHVNVCFNVRQRRKARWCGRRYRHQDTPSQPRTGLDPVFRFPQLDHPVLASGSQHGAVRAEPHRVHHPRVPAQDRMRRTRRGVPQAHGTVLGRRGEQSAVRAERHSAQQARFAAQGRAGRTRRHLPYPGRPVLTGRSHQGAVRAERYRARVTAQDPPGGAPQDLPPPCRPARGRRGYQAAVRADCHHGHYGRLTR